MALRLSISTPAIRSPSPQSTVLAHQRPAGAQLDTGSRSIGSARCSVLRNSTELKQKWARVPVRSSLETAGLTAAVGQVSEVNKDTFWPIVKAAGEKVVVLDMYTQWCGPCKIMAPRFQELSEKLLDVVFLKLDCNQENRPLAKELGIRVVPTFKILKDGKVVKEVTGAKFDDLVLAIETVKSSDASTHHPSSSVHNNTC